MRFKLPYWIGRRSPRSASLEHARPRKGSIPGVARAPSVTVLPAALLAVLATCVSAWSNAAPAPLRVRGASTIEASATALDGHVELKGALRDDTGRPIGNGHLGVRLLEHVGAGVGSGDGSRAVPLPNAEACPPSPLLHEARGFPGEADEYVIDTDESGGFCVRLAADVRGVFELTFSDSAGLYDNTRRIVELDHSRLGVELSFAAPPSSLPLEAAQNTLSLEVRMQPMPELRPELPVRVALSDRKYNTTVVAHAGEATPVVLPREALGRPGPVEIVAHYAGAERYQPAEARLRSSVTARVELNLVAEPAPGRPDQGIALQVAVRSAAGAVPSGSVEARLAGETVGIAEVKGGVALVTARFEVRHKSAVPITLVYLPAEPWWLASVPREITVQALPPSSWGRLGWIAALLLVASWLIAGWWRPRRSEAQPGRRADKPRAVAASIQLLESAEAGSGWRGKVIDAHEREPISSAVVTLERRSFEGREVVARIKTDADGEFEFEPLSNAGGIWLIARAATHSTLERPLPPAGRLSIELVTRRRHLIGRLVAWAERNGRPWADIGEPTPAHVAQVARHQQKQDVDEWARAVETAAFGPTPVDEALERQVVAREPKSERGEREGSNTKSDERSERDH